jgi:hypothetical protein
MDAAAIERFSGPVLAERAWISEQARACIVRPGNEDLETLVQRDVRGKGSGELVWDAWRRGDGRWTVVAALGDDAPISTWLYDPRSRSVQPEDAASHRLASEDVVVPLRPSTATVTLPREESQPELISDDTVGDAHDTATDVAEVDDASAVPTPEPEPAREEPARAKSRKGRRASVPRWDEILFGAGQSDA